ncbi:MAG: dihydroorotase [Acidimicrobiales bacterium]
MARYDMAVTGGRVVIPYVGEARLDIGIREGTVVALADAIRPAEADDRVDASGRVVLPGGVDAHFHLGIYRDLTADAESETTSSAVGGVTTVLSYFRTGQHYLGRSGPYKEILPEVLSRVEGHAKVDYGFHLAPMTAEHVAEIPWLVSEMGVSSFKYYMFYKGLNLAADSRAASLYTMADDYDLGHLMEIMEAASRADALNPGRVSVCLHCEQPELLRVFIERAKADPGLSGLAEYSAARPPLAERLSIVEAGVLADATGARVNLLHLSSDLALSTAVELGRRHPHLDLGIETTLHHLVLATEDLEGRGLGGKVNPPIRTRSDNDALWRGVANGEVSWVASDHACCMEAEKGDALWPALPGFGGTALLYPVLVSEGHHRRGIPLSRVAEVVAAAPARAYNLYPAKGTISVGSNADLAILDLELEQRVTPELCRSAQDHTPFEGAMVRGWPTTTLVRGRRVLDRGEVTEGWPGRYVRR